MDRVNELFADPVVEQSHSDVSPVSFGIDLDDYSTSTSIRRSIIEQVEEVQWMNDVRRKQESVLEEDASVASEKQRCVVCTLPLGSCPHTDPWLKSVLHTSIISSVDTEIDQVLGVLDTSMVIKTKPQVSDIDLDTIRWAMHNPRMSDKIGISNTTQSLSIHFIILVL